MHREAIVLNETASLREVAALMKEESVGCLIVVDDAGKATGIVTDRDLALRGLTRRADPDATPVREIVSQPLVTVSEESPRREAALAMRRHGVRRVPVVDGAGKPLGLVSLDDLLEDLGIALADVGSAYMTNDEPEDAEGRRYLEDHVARLRQSLRGASWKAQAAILDEIDELKDRAFRLLQPED